MACRRFHASVVVELFTAVNSVQPVRYLFTHNTIIASMAAEVSATSDYDVSETGGTDADGDAPRRRRRATVPLRRLARVGLIAAVVLTVAVGPAAAQADNPVCQDSSETLADMIEGFLQITVGLGVMGLLVVWQADSLMSMFRIPRDERSQLKQHRRAAGKSAVTLVVLGPLFAIAGSAMDLPVAQCVDLIPF
jgi:hypothetical protein